MTMKIMILNRKTGKEFKDVQVVTYSSLSDRIFITTSETLSNPHGVKTGYNVNDIEIELSNKE